MMTQREQRIMPNQNASASATHQAFHRRRRGILLRALVVVMVGVFLLLVALLSGCSGSMRQIQAQTATGIASAANSSLPMLVSKMRDEGFESLQEVLVRHGTREEAEAAIAAVEARWAPVWKAWDALRLAQGHWATALEAGGDLGAVLVEMKEAYCEFQAALPGSLPVIPLAPLRCEP